MNIDLNEEILWQNRHQFIYGYQTEDNKCKIKEIVDNNMIKPNGNFPIALYLNMENIALQNVNDDCDKHLMSLIKQEYFAFIIAYELLNKTLKKVDISLLGKEVNDFLKNINRLFINDKNCEVQSLTELLSILKLGCSFYWNYNQKIVETGSFSGSIKDIPISFMQVDIFLKYFKRLLNNSSHVALIIEAYSFTEKETAKVINSYLSQRSNSDLSIKVVCEPGKWPTYYDSAGNLVESIHDYGIVELDNSCHEYTEEIKKRTLKLS